MVKTTVKICGYSMSTEHPNHRMLKPLLADRTYEICGVFTEPVDIPMHLVFEAKDSALVGALIRGTCNINYGTSQENPIELPKFPELCIFPGHSGDHEPPRPYFINTGDLPTERAEFMFKAIEFPENAKKSADSDETPADLAGHCPKKTERKDPPKRLLAGVSPLKLSAKAYVARLIQNYSEKSIRKSICGPKSNVQDGEQLVTFYMIRGESVNNPRILKNFMKRCCAGTLNKVTRKRSAESANELVQDWKTAWRKIYYIIIYIFRSVSPNLFFHPVLGPRPHNISEGGNIFMKISKKLKSLLGIGSTIPIIEDSSIGQTPQFNRWQQALYEGTVELAKSREIADELVQISSKIPISYSDMVMHFRSRVYQGQTPEQALDLLKKSWGIK